MRITVQHITRYRTISGAPCLRESAGSRPEQLTVVCRDGVAIGRPMPGHLAESDNRVQAQVRGFGYGPLAPAVSQ